MSKRKVILSPHYNFDFKTNRDYETEWTFLKNHDRIKIIACQLTYLEFHAWLHSNIKTESAVSEDGRKDVPLLGDVSEGFIRTDILLYGAICESALYDLVEWEFQQNSSAIREVRNCFFSTKIYKHTINNCDITMHLSVGDKLGKLFLVEEEQQRKRKTEFQELIDAGCKLRVYDDSFKGRLNNLRKDRNSIHLGVQIKRKINDKYKFTPNDRKRAKDVTEELRLKIKNWYSNP